MYEEGLPNTVYEEMRKYLVRYEEAVIVIYDFATAPFWISLYMRKILFSFFISAIQPRSKIKLQLHRKISLTLLDFFI
jgi:hypothetical protein